MNTYVYHYHPVSFQYLEIYNVADESPLEPGKFIVPKFSTLVKPPKYNKETQYIKFEQNDWLIFDIEVPETVQPTEEEKFDALYTDLKAQIASKRYSVEVGGMPFMETTIMTDRESQSQITATYIALKENLLTSVNFKTANGFVELDLSTMEQIATALAVHVQRCFDIEKQHLENIELINNYTELQEYDINTLW